MISPFGASNSVLGALSPVNARVTTACPPVRSWTAVRSVSSTSVFPSGGDGIRKVRTPRLFRQPFGRRTAVGALPEQTGLFSVARPEHDTAVASTHGQDMAPV